MPRFSHLGPTEKPILKLLPFGIFFFILASSAGAQLQSIEWEDEAGTQATEADIDRELEYRAHEVAREYPWLVQELRGLALSAVNVPREKFLRGIHAASDLVFDGTTELPVRISLQGFFSNVGEVVQAVARLSPGMQIEGDISSRFIKFYRPLDQTVGLAEGDLVARYRRPILQLESYPRAGGIVLPGALFIEGNISPAPWVVEVIANQMGDDYIVMANGLQIKRFPFLDPMDIDRNLIQSQTMVKYREALKSKTDLTYWQVSQIPYSTSNERLNLTAAQMGYGGGLFGTRIEGGSIVVDLADGSKFSWSPDDLPKEPPMTESEAYRAAFQFQSLVLTNLASGNAVFCSDRFGFRVGPNLLTFGPEMESLSGDPELSSAQKEQQIRLKWPDDADWILEYFYTSVVKDVPLPAQLPYAAPPVGPLPTPNVPQAGAAEPGSSEDLIQQFLKERGLPQLR